MSTSKMHLSKSAMAGIAAGCFVLLCLSSCSSVASFVMMAKKKPATAVAAVPVVAAAAAAVPAVPPAPAMATGTYIPPPVAPAPPAIVSSDPSSANMNPGGRGAGGATGAPYPDYSARALEVAVSEAQRDSFGALLPRDTAFTMEPLTHPNFYPNEDLLLEDDRDGSRRHYVFEANKCRSPGALAIRDVESGRFLTNVGGARVRMTGFSDPRSCWTQVNLTCPGSEYTNVISASEPGRFLGHAKRRLGLGATADGPQFCWRR